MPRIFWVCQLSGRGKEHAGEHTAYGIGENFTVICVHRSQVLATRLSEVECVSQTKESRVLHCKRCVARERSGTCVHGLCDGYCCHRNYWRSSICRGNPWAKGWRAVRWRRWGCSRDGILPHLSSDSRRVSYNAFTSAIRRAVLLAS